MEQNSAEANVKTQGNRKYCVPLLLLCATELFLNTHNKAIFQMLTFKPLL